MERALANLLQQEPSQQGKRLVIAIRWLSKGTLFLRIKTEMTRNVVSPDRDGIFFKIGFIPGLQRMAHSLRLQLDRNFWRDLPNLNRDNAMKQGMFLTAFTTTRDGNPADKWQ